MYGDIAKFCKQCDVCQRVNNQLGRDRAELHPMPVQSVWKQVGIGSIGDHIFYILLPLVVSSFS